MIILVDTREQKPYGFVKMKDVSIERFSLETGDYSVKGFEDRIAIERKSLDDLIGCLTQGRERFERELARSKHLDFFAVIVEAAYHDIARHKYNSQMAPTAALQSISAFHVRYRTPFLFAGDRPGGEYLTHSLLAKYLKEVSERCNRASVLQQTHQRRKEKRCKIS